MKKNKNKHLLKRKHTKMIKGKKGEGEGTSKGWMTLLMVLLLMVVAYIVISMGSSGPSNTQAAIETISNIGVG